MAIGATSLRALVERCGWEPASARDWLAAVLVRELLAGVGPGDPAAVP